MASLQDYNVHTWQSNYGCLSVNSANRTLPALISRPYLCLDVPSDHVIPLILPSSWNLEATTGLLCFHSWDLSLFCTIGQNRCVGGSIVIAVSLLLAVLSVFLHVSRFDLGRCNARFGPTPDQSVVLPGSRPS